MRSLLLAAAQGNIYGKLVVDATRLGLPRRRSQTDGRKVSFTHLVGRAVAEALRQGPTLNGRIVFGEFEPFPTVDIAFSWRLKTAKTWPAPRSVTSKKSIAEIAQELSRKSGKLRARLPIRPTKIKQAIKMMPTWLLRPMLGVTGYLARAWA